MFKLETILAVFFTILSTLYIWHKWLNKKIEFKNYKFYVTLFSLMLIALINYFNVNAFVRISIVSLSLMIFFRYLFKETIQKCIITPIVSQMIVMISEMLFAIIISTIFKMDSQQIIETQFAQLFSNFTISLFSVLIASISFVIKFYKFIIKTTEKLSKKFLIMLSFFLLIIANILTMILYYKINFSFLLIFNTGLTLFCLFIVLNIFKTKNNYIKVYDKYNTTLNSLKEYEYMLDRYRVSNHENKNQLLTIRNMIPRTNKKTIAYIDKVIENKLQDDGKIMLETSKIPAGGLRGLIYSKILTMKDLKINYSLDISKDIKTVDLINIDDSLMLDICQVIGVYIDNAIQAVKDLRKKYVNIDIYVQNNFLNISITNNYQGSIDITKLEDKNYTTKGIGHGYGLTLAKQIVDNNSQLYNEKGVSKNTFYQKLKIKM